MLLIIAVTLVFFAFLDFFERWYTQYLNRLGVEKTLIRLLQRLKWVILAFMAWQALVSRRYVFELDSSHFLFALFAFAVFRLLSATVYNENSEKK